MLLRKSSLVIVIVLLVALVAAAQDRDVQMVKFSEDVLALEYIGNVNNSGTHSAQFGYFSYVAQLPAFNGTPEDVAHANFTFYTEALTERVTINGTLKIVDRTGTTTVYLVNSPATFSDPASFESGTPIQVSKMMQQVIFDSTTGVYTVVNVNTVTESTPFTINGQQYQLAKPGDRFRTQIRAATNATAPPGFFIAGYAVGASKH